MAVLVVLVVLVVVLVVLLILVVTAMVVAVVVVGNERMAPVGVVTNLLDQHQIKHRQLWLIKLLEKVVRLDDSVKKITHP